MVVHGDFKRVASKMDSILQVAERETSEIDQVKYGWKTVFTSKKRVEIVAADASRGVKRLENFYVFGVRGVRVGKKRVRAECVDLLPLPERGEEYVRFLMESVEAKLLSLPMKKAGIILFDGAITAAPSLVPVFPSGKFVSVYKKNEDLIMNYMVFFVQSLIEDYKKFVRSAKRGIVLSNVIRSLSTDYDPGNYISDAPNFNEVEELHESVMSLVDARVEDLRRSKYVSIAPDVLALMIYTEYAWSINELLKHEQKLVAFAKTGYRRYMSENVVVTDRTIVRRAVQKYNLPLPGFYEVNYYVVKPAVPGYLLDLFNKVGLSAFVAMAENDATRLRVTPHRAYYLYSRITPVYYVESFAPLSSVLPLVQRVIPRALGYPLPLKRAHEGTVIRRDEFELTLDVIKNMTKNPLITLMFGRRPLQ